MPLSIASELPQAAFITLAAGTLPKRMSKRNWPVLFAVTRWQAAVFLDMFPDQPAFNILDEGIEDLWIMPYDDRHMNGHGNMRRVDRAELAEKGNAASVALLACACRAVEICQPPAQAIATTSLTDIDDRAAL